MKKVSIVLLALSICATLAFANSISVVVRDNHYAQPRTLTGQELEKFLIDREKFNPLPLPLYKYDKGWNVLVGTSMEHGNSERNGCALINYSNSGGYAIVQCPDPEGASFTQSGGYIYIQVHSSDSSFEVEVVTSGGTFIYRENNIPMNNWVKIEPVFTGTPGVATKVTLKCSGLNSSGQVELDEFHCGTFYESFNTLSNSSVENTSLGRAKAQYH